MKKLFIILFCILVSMPVFAQMQGVINSSSERVILTFASKNNTKSLPYKDGIITSANAEQTNSATFYHTMPGTSGVSYASLHGIEVEDFSILGNMLFFCGNYQSTALIGWVSISDLFYASASIDVQYFTGYQNAYRIEAYQDNITNKVNLAVLAMRQNVQTGLNEYRLIDYPIDNSITTYDAYLTSTEIITDLAQTDNRIVALLDRKNYTDFSLLEYIKGNMQTNVSMAYQFTPGTYSMTSNTPVGKDDSTSYILTNEVGTENVFVCAQIEDHIVPYGRRPYIYHIDLLTFNPIYTQVLDVGGKPILRDIKYNPNDNKLYLLTNCSNGQSSGFEYNTQDVIYEFDKDMPGIAIGLLPNNSQHIQENMNSLTFYESYRYYLVSGIENITHRPYFFDRLISNLSASCYIYDKPSVLQANLQMLYPTNHNISNASKLVMQIPYTNGFMNYNVNCQY